MIARYAGGPAAPRGQTAGQWQPALMLGCVDKCAQDNKLYRGEFCDFHLFVCSQGQQVVRQDLVHHLSLKEKKVCVHVVSSVNGL